MDLKTLTNKCDKLSELRSQRDDTKLKLDEARQDFERSLAPMELTVYEANIKIKELQDEILTDLSYIGIDSYKTKKVMVSRKSSKTYKVTDTKAFIDSITKLNITDKIYEISLTEKFKNYSSDENIKGIEPQYKEFISVRKIK